MEFIQPLLGRLAAYLSPELAAAVSLASVLLVVVSALGALLFARWLPQDYFFRPHGPLTRFAQRRDIRYWLLLSLRQVLGLCLLLAGLAMLVLPGQGLLTIVAALCVAEYPGKRRLVRALVRRPVVQRGLNALRRRTGRPPLLFATPSQPPPPGGPDADSGGDD